MTDQYKVCMWTHGGEYLEKYFDSKTEAEQVLNALWQVPQTCKIHLCLVRIIDTKGPRAQELPPGWEKGWKKVKLGNSDN